MLEYSLFERLPFRSQAEAIAKDGTLLGKRTYNKWTVTLYELNNAFVELWSGREAQVFTTFKKSADTITILEPYIDHLEVNDLLRADQ